MWKHQKRIGSFIAVEVAFDIRGLAEAGQAKNGNVAGRRWTGIDGVVGHLNTCQDDDSEC
jgi:hypothetical protein